ncbi:hypothetical protein G7Y89_g3994 [Cudoniella acicularis]|uniref:Uncharacterized protein n=1 Tax=Cudoniella acicularis TaxID=354080 RepID=A0A8H4RR33_9HELO|nr:hypothetical protein G7Y89_g3994 [Cudoniella acicularis]
MPPLPPKPSTPPTIQAIPINSTTTTSIPIPISTSSPSSENPTIKAEPHSPYSPFSPLSSTSTLSTPTPPLPPENPTTYDSDSDSSDSIPLAKKAKLRQAHSYPHHHIQERTESQVQNQVESQKPENSASRPVNISSSFSSIPGRLEAQGRGSVMGGAHSLPQQQGAPQQQQHKGWVKIGMHYPSSNFNFPSTYPYPYPYPSTLSPTSPSPNPNLNTSPSPSTEFPNFSSPTHNTTSAFPTFWNRNPNPNVWSGYNKYLNENGTRNGNGVSEMQRSWRFNPFLLAATQRRKYVSPYSSLSPYSYVTGPASSVSASIPTSSMSGPPPSISGTSSTSREGMMLKGGGWKYKSNTSTSTNPTPPAITKVSDPSATHFTICTLPSKQTFHLRDPRRSS